jgi:hypothetical protein
MDFMINLTGEGIYGFNQMHPSQYHLLHREMTRFVNSTISIRTLQSTSLRGLSFTSSFKTRITMKKLALVLLLPLSFVASAQETKLWTEADENACRIT